MAKILQFPKSKSRRVENMRRALQQKAVIPLSILSVLVVTLSLNEWILTASQKTDQARGVASAPTEDLEKQIQWEHNWAQALQKSSVRPGQVAEPPNKLDDLLFGVLQGEVKMTRQGSQISSLDMNKPVELKNRDEFLESYKSAWSIQFERVELERSEQDKEIYRLLDKQGKPVGSAIFGLANLQKVTKLHFLTQ